MTNTCLNQFHPVSREWFLSQFEGPTHAQQHAWPLIAEGKHLLVCAPTGSGKTLTAFFYAIDGLLSGRIESGQVRILYVSPLKALNNDIGRNLLGPLDALTQAFRAAGISAPGIRVMTRSGDTPEAERRRMSSRPPEILITTPESLNILLTSKRGSAVLGGVKTVILDEIHAVADNKRGTYLITAVERLTRLSGEFQRIALSATVTPLNAVANFIGGFQSGKRRKVHVVAPVSDKSVHLTVRHESPVADEADQSQENPSWRGAAAKIADHIGANQTTLVFANSRRGVERLSRLINELDGSDAVYAHHGSLSKEIRLLVEERLKSGALKGVVATSSLELGIDIGHIDEVLMMESPFSIAATLQRLGRAGHKVGETSCGVLFVLYPQDAVNAAIIAKEVVHKRVEPMVLPMAPLDVLGQIILSICAHERWGLDDLYDHLKQSEPYHQLPRRLFDLVVEMLCGRYGGDYIPALKPRLQKDAVTNSVQTLESATRLLYRSGGTIPDRGYYSVRHHETRSLIGELDEEFVWERKLGDVITLGVQSWRILEITYSDVLVAHFKTGGSQTPFWRCEERMSSAYFADLRGRFLETADKGAGTREFFDQLTSEYFLDPSAARLVVDFLRAEQRALGVGLPHRHHVVVEKVLPSTIGKMAITVIHTEWGGKVNRPFAIALQTSLKQALDCEVQVVADDGGVAVALETDMDPDWLLDQVTPQNVQLLVRQGVEHTGLFGAAFRENAARALLILRARFGQRTPLWLNRKRAKELREKTAAFEDFPINLESFRSILQDECDLTTLEIKLQDLQSGGLPVSVVQTSRPSPFAESLVYNLTNELMYDSDKLDNVASETTDALIDAVLFSDTLRPRVDRAVIDALELKLKRLAEGYAPGTPLELLSWMEERLLMPLSEWQMLINRMVEDHHLDNEALIGAIDDRVVVAVPQFPNAPPFVAAVTILPRLSASFSCVCETRSIADPRKEAPKEATRALSAIEKAVDPNDVWDLDRFLQAWMRFYGPIEVDALVGRLPVSKRALQESLALLRTDDVLIVDVLTEGAARQEVCHTDIFRILLRMTRAQTRKGVSPKPLEQLPLFLASYQGVGDGTQNEMETVLERLFGYEASPALFEQEIFPARLTTYRKMDLDGLLHDSNLIWVGRQKEVYFTLAEDRALFYSESGRTAKNETTLKSLFPMAEAYTLSDLERRTGLPADVLKKQLSTLSDNGMVTASTFGPKRDVKTAEPRRTARFRPSKWKRVSLDMNAYSPLFPIDDPMDALDKEALNRDRIRQLLMRYGVVFKGLLEREMAHLSWGALFSTLRLMELASEVVGGFFFEGIPGIQFLSTAAMTRWHQVPVDPPIYWVNATDPASLCGVGLSALKLPPRVKGTHLVYDGHMLVVVSKRGGKSLEISVPPQSPRLPRYFSFIENMLCRDVAPQPIVTIEKINGLPAASSPYQTTLSSLFDASTTHRTLTLAKRFR